MHQGDLLMRDDEVWEVLNRIKQRKEEEERGKIHEDTKESEQLGRLQRSRQSLNS